MVQLIALHVMIFWAILTVVMGTTLVLKGARVFDLKIRTRNFMYVGACCAMALGFIGASVFLNIQLAELWHLGAATLCAVVGTFATAHISIDLSDRLRIVKRH